MNHENKWKIAWKKKFKRKTNETTHTLGNGSFQRVVRHMFAPRFFGHLAPEGGPLIIGAIIAIVIGKIIDVFVGLDPNNRWKLHEPTPNQTSSYRSVINLFI